MTPPPSSLDDRLAALREKKLRLIAREKQLEGRQKARDLRARAKGEKLLLRLVMARAITRPEFKAALLDQLTDTPLSPDERLAVLTALGLGDSGGGGADDQGAPVPPKGISATGTGPVAGGAKPATG